MALTDIKITDEQKMEWITKYINLSQDVRIVGAGQIILTKEASQRLAEQFKLQVAPGQLLSIEVVSDAIIKFESRKFFASESIRLSNERVELIRKLVTSGKNDYQIANELYEFCGGNLNDLTSAVAKAVKMEYLPQDNKIAANINRIINKNTATNQFAELYMKANRKIASVNGIDVFLPTVDDLSEVLATKMVEMFRGNALDFGNLVLALRDAIPEDEIVEEAIRMFYAKYEPFFIEKYGKSTLSDKDLANEIFRYYIAANFFDARVISGYVSRLNREGLNIDDFNYTLYCLDGEEAAVAKMVMQKDKTPEEIAQELYEYEIQFPVFCVKRTFDKLKSVKLPFEEIFRLYADKVAAQNSLDEEAAEVSMVPVAKPVAVLREDDETFVTQEGLGDGEEVAEAEAKVPLPRRLKIKGKKKEITEFGKKKTLGAILIAAGFLPVVVLSWQFKVDPSIAARNCAMAIEQLASGSMGIKDLLPSTEQLTALLAGMGTSLIGLVKYLRNKKKKKGATEELAEIETGKLDDELEVELERELSDGSGKKGKRKC